MNDTDSLVVLFDLNSSNWTKFHYNYKLKVKQDKLKQKKSENIQLEEIVEMTILHMFAHLSQSSNNKATFYCFDDTSVKKIFPVTQLDEAYVKMMNFPIIRESITTRIFEYLEKKELTLKKNSKIVKALGKSLCTLNKQKMKLDNSSKFSSRILIMFNSEIPSEKFKEIMSCIFVCQHKGYIVDAVTLNSKTDPFLLQATAKTNGLFFPCSDPTYGMMQYFLQIFNLRIRDRDNFKMPNLTYTPFNASCECHTQEVDLAWTCSVCLGIYCKKGKESCKGICGFCGARYDLVNFNQKLILNGDENGSQG